MKSNLPEAVYRCDLISKTIVPQNEVLVSRHATLSDAMDEANRLKRSDPTHSYVVGEAPCAY
jgi:hypothetical protein